MTDQLNLLGAELVRVVPHILGALLVLLVGYIVARVIQTAVGAGLGKAGLDRTISASPAGDMIHKVTNSPAGVIGWLAFWAILLGAISLAVSVLGIPALTAFVGSIYAYLPNVIAAFLILLVATVVATAVSGLVTRVMGDTPTGKMIAGIVPGLIFSIAIFMALNQLQIAPAIVTITYAAIIGSIALGAALAFGLGGRDVAGQMLQQAYDKGREQAGQVKHDMAQGKERGQALVEGTKQKVARQEPEGNEAGFSAAPSFGETIESFQAPNDDIAHHRKTDR